MSYKDEKIVRILLDEVKNVEVRCDDYHSELSEALAEIVQKERAHLFQRTNVSVEIGDIISRVAVFVGLKISQKETK